MESRARLTTRSRCWGPARWRTGASRCDDCYERHCHPVQRLRHGSGAGAQTPLRIAADGAPYRRGGRRFGRMDDGADPGRLAEKHLAPKPAEYFPFDIWHGYHFDSVLLGEFLKKKSLERGVRYVAAHVTQANLDERGAIASLSIREGDSIGGDLFVDCTGFAGLLITQAMKTPFVSFAENLFNDAAMAMPTPIGDTVPSQTVSTAMKHGWAWKIPLTHRFGNGYVYSTQFCTPDEAERELREHLGLLESDRPARYLKMKIGRGTQHWNKNCLAVGLSQGFIEPLEATALLFIQQTAASFVNFLEAGDLSEAAHETFNAQVNEHFEGTRDYIVTHYKTNSRRDPESWRANAANLRLSEPLKQLLSLWMSGKGIAPPVRQQMLGKGYPVFC